MKLIKSHFEIIEQEDGLDGIYKLIEQAGRTCYKSNDKITEGSAKKFVDMMIKSGHGAMLEHGTVYLKVEGKDTSNLQKYQNNKYSKFIHTFYDGYESMTPIVFITTNLRVLVENGWMDDLQYLCEPTEYHERRICVKWHCDRVTGESFLRHRVFSFARESTRYCNFSKDKFGNEITFVEPSWKPESLYIKDVMLDTFKSCEESYLALIRRGLKPQQARQVLPFSLYSPLVMTGFVSDWEHFFDLRCDSHAHPDAQALAKPLKDEFIKRGYIGNK